MHILLIEDDPVVAESLGLMLRAENFHVHVASSGEEGIEIACRGEHDLLLLDLKLPDISGYEVLRDLRQSRIEVPVLILSGMADITAKVRSFGFGADDYLTKPFHKDELVARIHAVARRARPQQEPTIRCGDLVVNQARKMAEIRGHDVPLTSREYQLLELLAVRQGSTLKQELILSQMYGGMDEPEQKIIDVYVCKLRKKLGDASGGQGLHRDRLGPGVHAEESEGRTHSSLGALGQPRPVAKPDRLGQHSSAR
jgi:two-component system, cell cycle response regulator CtrA